MKITRIELLERMQAVAAALEHCIENRHSPELVKIYEHNLELYRLAILGAEAEEALERQGLESSDSGRHPHNDNRT